jgi:hypothetical protein
MTVKDLIKILEKIDGDKIVVMTDPDGICWTNVGDVVEEQCEVKIIEDGDGPFHDS